jgi:hypothetical protein
VNIKKFEKYVPDMIPHPQDSYYEIWRLDNNGDEERIDDGEVDFNPYDLDEVVKEYIKYKGYNKHWFIKNIIEEIVDLTTIPEINLILKSNKYNL